jgi:hypothetical protein
MHRSRPPTVFVLCLAAFGIPALAAAQDPDCLDAGPTDLSTLDLTVRHQVRGVYLTPADRPFRPCLAARLQTFIRMAQRFFQEEMASYGYLDSRGQGKTFPFEKDSSGLWKVVFLVGEHDSSYYQERSVPEDPGREPFAEMLRRLPEAFHNENVTLYFYDIAEVRDGMLYYSGQGGTAAPWEGEGAGWALIGAHVLGMGFDTLALSIDEQGPFFEDTELSGLADWDGDQNFHVLSRGEYASTDLGAAMHELGHTFGLLHDHVDHDGDGIETNLMGNGFRRLSGRYTQAGYIPATGLGPTHAAELDLAILFNEGLPPSELLLDDGQPGTVGQGTWRVSGGAYPYGARSLYASDASASYSFSFTVREPGPHQVALRWTGWPSRLPDVPVAIAHAGGTSTVAVDQTRYAGKWVPVGSYDFEESATVTIISPGGGSTCADGARLTRVFDAPAPEAVILDDGDPGTSAVGYWPASGGAEPHGGDSLYSKVAGASYSFELPLAAPGAFDVYVWWTEYPSRREDVPMDIVHAAGTSTVRVDQQADGGMWNLLGRWAFGTSARIVVRSLGGGTTCADAVRLVSTSAPPPPFEVVLDNGQPGTTATGPWSVSGGANPFGTDSLYSKTAGATYRFHFGALEAGSHEVFLWWTEYSSRQPSVPIRIRTDGAGEQTRYVDQTRNGGRWVSLGEFAVVSSLDVTVESTGTGSTCADAARVVKK